MTPGKWSTKAPWPKTRETKDPPPSKQGPATQTEAEVCLSHHFPQSFGESRCSRCAIRRNYLNECLGMLYKWPKADQKSEEWKRKYDSLMHCPHSHVHLPKQENQP
jgi:hypothetical protein